MELNSQINTFSKGMNADVDITMLPEGQYRYAENIRLLTNSEGTTGMLQNIEHIRQYTGGIPTDEIILGTAATRLYNADTNGTIECGIVFTKKMVGTKVYNKLYKVTGFESTTLTSTVITEGYLDVKENVSIVTNYESDYVSNVYICDGLTPIKVINICDDNLKDSNGNVHIVYDKTRFDITPGCTLMPFKLINTINGALPAGAIQYCYQLFNQNGPETTTSSLSEVIPITKYDHAGNSAKIQGQMKGELSDRGCQIQASFKNDGRFDRARIFSIVYLDNVSVPDIYIINEIEIPISQDNEFTTFTYNDTGASFLSKITIDEFNQLVPFEFNAKIIEKMSNRLFAANIQEITWDVEYDARAYRCNVGNFVVLDSSDLSQRISGTLNENGEIIASGAKVEVPKEHDCINPSNVKVLEEPEYIYKPGGSVKGGLGPNVSYEFVYTELVLADSKGSIAMDSTVGNNGLQKITIFDEKGETKHIVPVDNTSRLIVPNYSDPFICANYLGYKRDEIYRFGVIFYNNKNIPSPVHWIGDIRMPKDDLSTVEHPFHKDRNSLSYNQTKELIGYALGVEFTLNNIPAEAVAYEIVRCDRNEQDRTIVTQGIMGALYKFDTWGNRKHNYGENDTRPAPLFNLANNFKTVIRHDGEDVYKTTHQCVPGYFEFVSPEICITKDSMISFIQNGYLNILYKTNSLYDNRVTIPQASITNIAETGAKENDPNFGYVKTKDGVGYFNAGDGEKQAKWGYGGVFKYYTHTDAGDAKTTIEIQDGIIGSVLPTVVKMEDSKNYVQFIGNKAYVNTSVGGFNQISNHGINAVIQVDILYYPYVEPYSAIHYCTALVADVKQNTIPYGGNTYISRQNSIYTSCNGFNPNVNNSIVCYGGDTYLGVFDYLNTSVVQRENDPNKYRESRLCCVCYIPLETTVNVNLRGDSYHRQVTGEVGPNLFQNEPTVMANGWVQKAPYYEYNPVYSTTSGSKQYIPKSIYHVDDMKNQTRIVASELKTNNEMTDSWTKFKFANYIDVDSQYGQVTNLKSFNNRLFYWQDNAVGVAAVNERSLITDNNIAELTLGTGGILARFDYVATLNGSSIVNDKSITNSATTVYWYDFDKNEICALGNGVTSLSKIKGNQTYLNTLPRSVKGNAVSFYDKKYNEVWFRIYDKSLIYNEQLQAFTSFYTHNPNWFFPFSDKLVTIKDNNMYYLHNIYEIDDSTQPREERISKVEFVVNKDISNTKVFDNVIFSADLLEREGYDEPIVKDIVFKTKTQETSALTINDIELREDNYRFAIPREKASGNATQQLTSQSYLGRMRGKYLICDYTFDCNNNREFKLPYIKTTYRYSML